MNGLCAVLYIVDVLRKMTSDDTDYMTLLSMDIVK